MRPLLVLLALLVASPLLAGCSAKPPATSADAAADAADGGRESRGGESDREPSGPQDWQVSAGAVLHYLASAPVVGECSAFTFPVVEGATQLIAGAGHAIIVGTTPPGVGTVRVELVEPDGTVLQDEHALGAGPASVQAPSYVIVEAPAAGDWTLRVAPSSPMVNQDVPLGYQFGLNQTEEPPTGTIDGPKAC